MSANILHYGSRSFPEKLLYPSTHYHLTSGEAVPLSELGIGDNYSGGVPPNFAVEQPVPVAEEPAIIVDQPSVQTVKPYYAINHWQSGALWAYIIIVIIVAVMLFLFVADRLIDGWYERLKKPISLELEAQLVIWAIVFFLLVVVAYFGHVWALTEQSRQWLTWIFLGNQVLLVVWFFIFFGQRNLELGFAFAIFTLLSALIWWYLISSVDLCLSYLLAVYVFWLAYLVIEQWTILCANSDRK